MAAPSFAAIEEGARAIYIALEIELGISIEDMQREWEAMDDRDRLFWRSIALKAWNAFEAYRPSATEARMSDMSDELFSGRLRWNGPYLEQEVIMVGQFRDGQIGLDRRVEWRTVPSKPLPPDPRGGLLHPDANQEQRERDA